MISALPSRSLFLSHFAPISLRVNPRAIFTVLIAAAMLLAPLAMQSGAAMAMAPGDHQSQMMETGHCGTTSSDTQDADKDEATKSCCVAMCAAAALSPAVSLEPHVFEPTLRRATAQDFQFGYFGELPTPPPRSA